MFKSRPEDQGLNNLVDHFAELMRSKFQKKFKEGYHGWDSGNCKGEFFEKLLENAQDGNWVNVANMAAILWNIDLESESLTLSHYVLPSGKWTLLKDKFPKDKETVQLLLGNDVISEPIEFDEIETMLDPKYSGAHAWKPNQDSIVNHIPDTKKMVGNEFSITKINAKIKKEEIKCLFFTDVLPVEGQKIWVYFKNKDPEIVDFWTKDFNMHEMYHDSIEWFPYSKEYCTKHGPKCITSHDFSIIDNLPIEGQLINFAYGKNKVRMNHKFYKDKTLLEYPDITTWQYSKL